MKQYFDMDQRLKKLVVFMKNWIPNDSNDESDFLMAGLSDRILGRKFNDLSLKCMLIAFMQHEKLIPNCQQRVITMN